MSDLSPGEPEWSIQRLRDEMVRWMSYGSTKADVLQHLDTNTPDLRSVITEEQRAIVRAEVESETLTWP